MFSDQYKNQKVLVTGHTGFKGSWLTTWLLKLGARVVGVSIDIPTTPSLFKLCKLDQKITHYLADVRDLRRLREIIEKERPNFIFHLAAQAIVSQSYQDPLSTISTNAIGTANLLEVLRTYDNQCCAVFITSDKCYENVEWSWGYREDDRLGGKDPYSASKATAEIIFRSFYESFLRNKKNIRIASARAGNVIGGGDWAADRIVADCFRAWSSKKPVKIRCPEATRPWQHVLEPLGGYLQLGMELCNSSRLDGESFNFGPNALQNQTVLDLISDLHRATRLKHQVKPYEIVDEIPFNEASLLKLSIDKAVHHMAWLPTLDYSQTIEFIADWYNNYLSGPERIHSITAEQISQYEQIARTKKILWAQ